MLERRLIKTKKLTQLVFTVVATCCLSQDILYINKRLREVPKVELVQSAAVPNKNKNIDNLFINFLLR